VKTAMNLCVVYQMGSLEQILKGAQVVIKISPQPHILLMWLNPERACSAHEKNVDSPCPRHEGLWVKKRYSSTHS